MERNEEDDRGREYSGKKEKSGKTLIYHRLAFPSHTHPESVHVHPLTRIPLDGFGAIISARPVLCVE